MYRFSSDYCEGAHPRILEKLIHTNDEQTAGYGEDRYCRARRSSSASGAEAGTPPSSLFRGGPWPT